MKYSRLRCISITTLALLAFLCPLPPLSAQETGAGAALAELKARQKRTVPLSADNLQTLFPEALHDERNQCLTFCLERSKIIAFLDAQGNVGFISIRTPSNERDKVTDRLAKLLQMRDLSRQALGRTLLIDEVLLRQVRLPEESSLIPATRMAFVDALLDWDERFKVNTDRSTPPYQQRKKDVIFTGWKSSLICFRIRDFSRNKLSSYELGISPTEAELHTISIHTYSRFSDDDLCTSLRKYLRLDGHYTDDARIRNLRTRTGLTRLLLYNSFQNIYIGTVRHNLYKIIQESSQEEEITYPPARTEPEFPRAISSWPTHSMLPKTPMPPPARKQEPSREEKEAGQESEPLPETPTPPEEPKELPILTPQQALRTYIQKLRTL